MCKCMYILCVCTSTLCLLLCTPFIADEELYRWIVGLKRRLLHSLIAMICALLLQNFPYLIFLSVEFKGNPCINWCWFLPTSLCWSLTSNEFDLSWSFNSILINSSLLLRLRFCSWMCWTSASESVSQR
jgi:hypothetical protein